MAADLSSDQKGSIAESAVILAATRLGLVVSKPLFTFRYDLVVDVGDRLLRVQCKYASARGAVIVVPCRTCRRGADGFVRTTCTADEVDGITGYCAALDRLFYLPMHRFEGQTLVQLRTGPTRNNQQAGINWADDYEFDATIGTLLGP